MSVYYLQWVWARKGKVYTILPSSETHRISFFNRIEGIAKSKALHLKAVSVIE